MVRPLRLLFTRLTRQLLFSLPRRSCGGRNLCSQGFRFLPAQERRGKGAALWLLLALAVLVGTACFTPTARPGSTLPTPPTLPPVVVAATPTPAPTATPVPTPTPAPEPSSGTGWRTDIPVGDAIGSRASEVTLTLADGSVQTAESLAAGRSVLLYFFATW